MAFQPPTRPHTANPRVVLNTSIFHPRPGSAASNRTSTSVSSANQKGHGRSKSRDREHEWEDAWDSGSDHEDLDHPSASGQGRTNGAGTGNGHNRENTPAPIPIRTQSHHRQDSGGSTVAASWASGSYQHVSHRPPLSASKTYTEGAIPPPPGTALHSEPMETSGTSASGSRLPPGGAWEIIEPVQEEKEVVIPVKVGKEAIRANADDILKDPLQLLASLHISPSAPSTPTSAPLNPSSVFPFLSSGQGSSTPPISGLPSTISVPEAGSSMMSRKEGINRQRSVRTERRREKFAKVLKGREEDGSGVDLGELRRLAWSGVPNEVRPIVWQLLLNYLPLPVQPRLTTLQRKRKEYSQLVDQYFGRGLASLDQQMWHQIEIDVPRTRPGIPLWAKITAQRSLERILYVWATRHPASGYVQGINDLVTPFFQVFLSAYIDTDPELFDVGDLDPAVLAAIEADSFWCLSKLLDGIQDNYISQQPGIQRLVKRMSELVKRIDSPLAAHFEEQGIEFMQFAFRWMNCLLMREISMRCTVRMWDTYLAEGTDAFSQFHLYVCSALLVKFSERLREMDFQEMIMFLQCLPTQTWTDHDIELLLSEAYVLKTVWQGAENHFANQKSNGGGFGMLGR